MNIFRVAVAVASACVAVSSQSPASAAVGMPIGNYETNVIGRYDFHTWVWAVAACPTGSQCVHIVTIPRPVAKAFSADVDAPLRDGRYTMVFDDPFGLRCDNVYYGRVIPTHDTYAWDATTLEGTVTSEFPVGCNGEPGGDNTYSFQLQRM